MLPMIGELGNRGPEILHNVAAIWKLQCKSIWLPNLEERSRWLINAAVAFTVNCG